MKRVFDVLVSTCLLLLFSPYLIFIALQIIRKVGSPVLFFQERVGLNEKIFKIIKVRTMSNSVGLDGSFLPDEQRLTSFGLFLRKKSLDELPELWNVFRGEMSLVGPRPLLVDYLSHYTPEQARRHTVRPGITGWAQIKGRNAISWEEKFALDTWYVDNQSIWLDIKILFLTIKCVVKSEGIYTSDNVAMPKFGENREKCLE